MLGAEPSREWSSQLRSPWTLLLEMPAPALPTEEQARVWGQGPGSPEAWASSMPESTQHIRPPSPFLGLTRRPHTPPALGTPAKRLLADATAYLGRKWAWQDRAGLVPSPCYVSQGDQGLKTSQGLSYLHLLALEP